jgi:UDPglucose 6-dehydrogenase
MKVGIIGLGFVGNALANSFNGSVKVLKIDPKLNTSTKDLRELNPDLIFICVPTPMKQNGDQDISILDSVILDIVQIDAKCPIILKSTLLPINLNRVLEHIPDLVYNPEFLREKHAIEDFKNAKFHIFGGHKDKCKIVSNFFKDFTNTITAEHIFMDIIAASFFKYTVNSYLSIKVTFFNELFDLFKETGSESSWDDLIDALKKDPRLGSSHMSVPGHDGRRGFGGACLPKDVNAFHKYSIEKGTEISLLKKIIDINNKYRSGYNELTDREKQQNISYKD